ncbi:MAG: hypothetical protein COA70_01755 [Planctomycetota bacterium]|nr:MAG: hypothetical protein COA70_01755 [Planctomycetota bacterium]
MKKHPLIFICSLVVSSTMSAAQIVDVNQPLASEIVVLFSQADLAQSFSPTKNTCSGFGLSIGGGLGATGLLTVELWDALPNVPGALQLASASQNVVARSWADLIWPSVAINPGVTHYLIARCSNPQMSLRGETSNPYVGGQMFANAGFDSFPQTDFAFRTWADGTPLRLTITGSCPTSVTFTVVGADPNWLIAFLYGNAGGSFTVSGGPCAGVVLDIGSPVLVGFFHADATGVYTITTPLPAGLCGKTIQVVDVTSCATSNTVVLP